MLENASAHHGSIFSLSLSLNPPCGGGTEFERQARELQLRYEKKLNTLREEMNLQRKNEVMEISHRKNQHIRVRGSRQAARWSCWCLQ